MFLQIHGLCVYLLFSEDPSLVLISLLRDSEGPAADFQHDPYN